MLFRNLILELRDGVAAAVEELFSAARASQTHPQDLLLVDQHGFHWDVLANAETNGQDRLSPYVIGPGGIGLGEETFYEFIDWFRKSHELDKEGWEERVAQDVELQQHERLTIQVEQGIYLRFWEADSLLKQYHQLASLAVGEPYDWHLTIPSHSRRGSKHEFIRKGIRDRVNGICPRFYALVKENYKTQVRDAIAHSQFFMVGRTLRFLNCSSNSAAHAPLTGMSFDDWYRQFHATLLLHDETIGASGRHRKRYEQQAIADDNRLGVRITDRDGSQSFRELALHANGRWGWQTNLSREAPRQ